MTSIRRPSHWLDALVLALIVSSCACEAPQDIISSPKSQRPEPPADRPTAPDDCTSFVLDNNGQAVFASRDAKEGPKAFAEKRKPNFQNR